MTKTKGKTLADFRFAHDRNVVVPNKLKAALAQLAAEGEENWAYEQDLLGIAKISTTDLSQFRDQFSDHVVETTGKNAKRIWFANIKVAARARGK